MKDITLPLHRALAGLAGHIPFAGATHAVMDELAARGWLGRKDDSLWVTRAGHAHLRALKKTLPKVPEGRWVLTENGRPVATVPLRVVVTVIGNGPGPGIGGTSRRRPKARRS